MSNPYFLTWQEVLDQLLSFLPPAWRSNLSGKVLKRLLVAFSLSIEALYALLARVLRLSIVATSEGGWLRALVSGIGMTAYGGVAANVIVRFERYVPATEAIDIPIGTEPVTGFNEVFQVSIAAVLPAGATFVDVPCVAVRPGTTGNIAIDEIIGLRNPITGIDKVSNPNPGFGGAAPESDQEIKARVPKHLEMLHRATIPAVEFAIATNREKFPEVQGFLTQRSYGTPGYFRGILSDYTGGDLYRPRNWQAIEGGVYFVATTLTEIQGLVAAGFPCRRFGVVDRSIDGEEFYRQSLFLKDVEAGDWRWLFDANLGRIYAKADGRNLNELEITIYAGLTWRVLRELEQFWVANGVFCDVLVPFVTSAAIALTYTLEPGYEQVVVERELRGAISAYIQSLAIGQDFEIEGVYALLSRVSGATGVLVISPPQNVSVAIDSVFRLSSAPTIARI